MTHALSLPESRNGDRSPDEQTGLSNVTSSEVAGTTYDKVVSLSGAGMPEEWRPRPGTSYTDLSYNDILQGAQGTGLVWGGHNPRSHPAFDHGDYYVGPNDGNLAESTAIPSGTYPAVYIPLDDAPTLMENHNLIATDSAANKKALSYMDDLVTGL